MTSVSDNKIPESEETGFTGIYHLKRIWYKTINGIQNESEWQLDNALLNTLGIGLFPVFHFLHEQHPDFDSFEKWVVQQHNGSIPETVLSACNSLFTQKAENLLTAIPDVLSGEDLEFWKENGYIIVRNAISKEDCAACREAIWNYMGKKENDPATWYTSCEGWQGIMVQLFRNPALDRNRASPLIRKAFEQIWGHNNLIVTMDKTSFNPPVRDNFSYRGIGLHWDVSLKPPVPFGVQGLLYLTNTAAHQGAFTLIPGFHKKIDQWLADLPAGTDPRNIDLQQFGPVAIAANEGDLIIWHHALPHGSSPNNANTPRLVQYLYWHPPIKEEQLEWV